MLTINNERVFKIVILTAYSLIILMGQLIGMPLILWNLFTSFDFGNEDQLFAISGLIGMVLMFTKLFQNITYKILTFGLLLTPIIRRVTEVPIEKFNYLSFQVPLLVFILSFSILFFESAIKLKR
ncbi:hypothetical protein GGR27_003792 [Lewinella antarctica]|uniref:Uncharacterized protein n=1 Tax=Neolewinella antarctica TaxID=442734 RepID=A0ABX0XG26_9BACT|nr:hypothetical protein [Neolewinella antarctica]